MRKSKLTPQEVQAAEMAGDERRYRRGMGFSLMDIRDRGWVRLKNGSVMIWPVDRDKRRDGELYHDIPAGHFLLYRDGEYTPYEADEFQKYLRWVG